MATDHNFRIKNGLEVGGSLIVNSSGQLVAVTASSHIHYLDNVQAKFGNGGDLQIYHDGNYSYIKELGNGGLYLDTNGDGIYLRGTTGNKNMVRALKDGAVTLYHNGSAILATTSGGVDITNTGNNTDIILTEGGTNTDARIRNSNGILELDADLNNEYGNSSIVFKVDGSTKAEIDRNGRLYLSGTTANYQSSDGNYLRNTTAFGYIQIGPGNAAHAHFLTDRSNFYFNKQIQVDTGIITSHNEDLILRRAQTSASGQLTLGRGKFVGGSQSASDLLNSSTILGGFHANTAFEEAYGHFYIPGLSPNQLAGSHRRHTVTVTKNGTTQSGDYSNMFSANGVNTSFSHAAGSTDTIVITITGIAMAYGQHVGVQFGHPTFRAKDIEIEITTDNGSNWTSIYDVTNFPEASVAHYHGGSGTATNGIRYTFTNFNNTGMRINQLFCYDYSENEIYFAEKNQDQTIRGNWTWPDNYKAKFGSSGDLEIWHSTSDSFIRDVGTGNLYLDSSALVVRNYANSANMIVASGGGSVALYHNGNIKLQTESWGALVTGTLNADSLHLGSGASDLIDVHQDGTFTATYRNNTGGVLDRRYADYGNDGTTVEFQTRVGMDGNYSSIGNFSNHGLQIRTNNANRLNISSTGTVEVQGTAHFIAPTIRLANDATDTTKHRVAVYDSGGTSYGMMLWNSNVTSGDWATMIYGPNQANRRISFGKVTNNTFSNHSHVTEAAHFDLDTNDLILNNGTLFATGTSDGVVARKGAFGPTQTSLHGSYDLYNNGTTYLNGAVTVDDNLDVANKIRHIGDTDTYLAFANANDFRIVVGNSTRAAFNTSKIHFNQEGIDQDFQVESNNSTHMLFVDAGLDRVGMGTNSPEYPLHVQGVVDGDFGIGIFNQKSYGSGTGVNETATLTLGIKESGLAAANRIFGQIRVATTNESSSGSGRMSFNVRSAGSVVERAVLDNGGNFTVDGTLIGSNVNTGQGATEVHLMNQNVRTTDSPTFASLTLTGDLNITGDINTVTVNDLDVQDKTITVAAGAASSSAADEAGLIIGGAGSKILWDHAEDKFQFSHGINFDRDTYSETNQNLGIYWSAWDKESGGDQSDSAFIRHTENTGGHSNSVLEIKSGNDSGDGIAFTTHSGSTLKHNSSNILTAANFTSNITNLLTTSTTFAGDVDGTYNNLVIDVPTQTSAPTASTGRLWWDSNTGNLKIYNGSVWVTAAAIPDVSGKYDKTGGAITGAVSMSSTLAVTGNITGSANIQGNAIIKTGGTSSQFLKADGSVDSSTYLTGNQTITLTGDVTGSGTTSIATVVGDDSHNHSSSSGNFSVGGTLFVTQKIEHTGDSNTYMEFNSGDEWRVVTGGTERIRIQGGDIGIGNVGPTDGDLTLNSPKLHVKGPDTTNKYNLVARFQGGTDSDNTGGAILINHSNDRGLLIEGGRSSSDRGVGYIGLLNSGAAHTRIMGFYQDGTTYTAGINIDPGTYPHTELQVGNPEIASTGITIASRYDASAAKLTFRTGHPNNANVWNTSQIASTDDGNYNGRLEFRTSVSGQAAPTTRMFIRANGRVGIGNGVFTPDALLDVNGESKYRAKQETHVAAGNYFANYINTTESNFRLTMYNNGTGNGSNQYAFKFGLHYGTTANANIMFYRGGSSVGGFLAFTTNNDTERMRIHSGGGISVGTTTTPPSGGILSDNDIKTNSRFGVGSGGNLTDAAIYKNDDTDTGIIWPSTNALAFITGGVNRLNIASSGEVEFDKHFKSQSQYLSGATNFDNLKVSGFYSLYNANASGHTNAPFQYGAMIQAGNTDEAGGMGMQIAHERTGAGTYIRGMNDSNDTWYSWQRIFMDNYHPNADKWTTARTLTLAGDLTGNVSFDGSANFTLTAAVVSDSHNHTRFDVSGISDLNSVSGANNTRFRPFVSNFQASNRSGSNYNGGFEVGTGATNYGSQFVFEANAAATQPKFRNKINGTWGAWQSVFADGYHPNADKWTTARSHTVTLSGEVTGTATQSVDGTGNKTWSIATTLNHSSLDDQYLIKDGANIQAYSAGSNEMFKWQNNTSGGIIQLGFQQSDTDGLHHRLYLRAYKGSAGSSGNVDIIVRGTGGSITSDVLELHSGQRAAWQGNDIFTDGYHPNADKWTTARSHTVTLTGDVTGTATQSVDGTGNKTWSITTAVADNSHIHDHIQGASGTATNLNTIASQANSGELHYDSFSTSAANKPNTSDNANGVITVGQHSGPYTAQLAFSSDGFMYHRDNPNNTYGGWNKVFQDNYHPNADIWTTTRTDTVTLTGDATGTSTVNVNGSGNWTNSVSVTVGSIDGQQFYNTRSNSGLNSTSLDGNGIFYYTAGPGNFSGNSTDGAAYMQSYSSSWQHTILGDYRSGAIAVKSRNSGTWQETKRIPMIFTGSTTPTITTHADNAELWYDTSDGTLKFYYNDGTSSQWVDAVAVPSISNLYSKGGGAISGAVSIGSTLNVTGITELDNELFVDINGGANGTSNQVARFSNITTGATSGYIYLGANSGGDWKIGKNVPGTSSRTNFDIALHTNALAMSIDGNKNAQFFGTEISGITGGTGTGTTHLKRIGGIYLGWDNATYGVQDSHSIKSTYGTNYIDSITVNSYNHIRFNIDTNGNNTDEVFQVGRHTTGTGNILMTLDTSGNFSTTGNVTAYSSDRRLKKNFKKIDNALDKVLSLNGYNFDWRMDKLEGTTFEPDYETNDVGLIAQEVQAVCEQATGPAPFDIQYNEETKKLESQSGEDYLTVNYDKLVPLLVESIKEQQTIINKLEQRLSDLEKREE